jgi:FAD synthase
MRLLRQLATPQAGTRGYVAAIGGFDGIHLGHRALIARVSSRRRA